MSLGRDSSSRHIFPLLLVVAALVLVGCGLLNVTLGSPGQLNTPPAAFAPTLGAESGPTIQATTSAESTPGLALTPSGLPTALPNQPGAALLQPTGNLENDIRAVVDRVRPAVVFVGIEASVQQFSQPVPVGNGSGAIIDEQGHVVTNNHVVAQAQALKVTLPDGRTFDAKVIGTDPVSDLAVIQISGSNLPTIPLGDSSKLRVGDWVVAIGNALGLEGGPTVTKGVVSAMNRSITDNSGATLSNLIQTDAAINPGNSGGPLVNLRGELVGINTAIPGPTNQGVQPYGIGFAIAINEAKPIINQLIQTGHVTRPYLGVGIVSVTPAISAQLGLNVNQGAAIVQVAPNSPAARAGLREGDVIVGADGKPVTNEGDLRAAIQAHKIGDTITLMVLRGGQQLTVTAQLAQAPSGG